VTGRFHAPTNSISTVSGAFASADVATLATTMNALDLSAQNVAKSLQSAFTSASASGKSFDTVLTGILSKLASMSLSAAFKIGGDSLSGMLTGALSSSMGSVTPFASGGIVSSPTFFGADGGLGVMGERGAEAIMPLARGPDGTLGLAAGGQGGGTHVTVNISAMDVESFRRSEQQVSTSLARAVSRGQRSL